MKGRRDSIIRLIPRLAAITTHLVLPNIPIFSDTSEK